MRNYYEQNEYCMNFTNDELLEYLISKLENIPNIEIKLSSFDTNDITIYSNVKIQYISLDGEKENFYISLNGFQTAVFILNEEFMFIDDEAKKEMVSSETYHNVVYEGYLRDKTHEEILGIIFELIKILHRATKIEIEEEVVSQEGVQYPKCKYTVKLEKYGMEKRSITFENILFLINS